MSPDTKLAVFALIGVPALVLLIAFSAVLA